FNPYPFPWSNHLFQDSASLAMGVFEGHMAKMAEGFRAIRATELELAGKYVAAEHDEFLARFSWEQFSDEEFDLCPPVVALGGDGAMYDIGFQNLSRMMMSGKPIKVVVVDTQVYSNTGGQACTSGFVGQVSDMAAFGAASPGKTEIRKEIGLIAMAHRTTYVMQSSIAHASHMIEGFIEGLRARRPALFNLYTSCQPEHGIGDDMGYAQAKLAVESRAYPLFRYHPDRGVTPQECFDLDGNPALYDDWPTYELAYREAGREKSMTLPLTFADFAMTEGRFRKHFRTAPPDTWHDNMRPLAEFLELDADDRDGLVPFIWSIDSKQRLSRLLLDGTMVASCEERRDFWHMLKAIARAEPEAAVAAPDTAAVTQDVVGNIARGLMRLAGGEGESGELLSALLPAGDAVAPPVDPAVDAPQAEAAPPAATDGEYMAPWLDTQDCTACDECTAINDRIFTYNEAKKAYIKDPDGGPYRDLVKAAEKCTARVIHPGLPRDRGDKDILKWIKRGEKYN
ncbi:MAG: pyruvate ferredoxin oxidoreductase, partial [Halioglobus sp.]|nr:pyruvate ferredoxin oxidoreductase [Halioglobus sp.]